MSEETSRKLDLEIQWGLAKKPIIIEAGDHMREGSICDKLAEKSGTRAGNYLEK